jgi:hypothetical protein
MRDPAARWLALLAALTATMAAWGADDEKAMKIAVQKKAAAAAWALVEAGPMASTETKHLLVYAPKAMEKRLTAIGTLLEKYHDLAIGALAIKPEEAYPGKITVFLLPKQELLPAFARRVEKRRPMSGETGSFSAKDETLHAVSVPGEAKAIPVEARAGEQLASLLLMRRAGVRTNVPDWLINGFGRATSYRVLPREKFVLEDRKQARVLVRKREASAVWDGTVEAEEVDPMQGSLVEMLAYGSKRFGKLLDGYKPGENVATKTTGQAMEAAGISPEKVAKAWKAWVR